MEKGEDEEPAFGNDRTPAGGLTFAASLVHDLQVRVPHAAGHQQGALVLVRLPVAAAHSVLPGNVGAVRGAHALGPSHLHFANLPGAAFDSLACVWTSRASVSRCCISNVCRRQAIPASIFPQNKPELWGFSPDRNTLLTWHNIYIHHISLLTVTQRDVSRRGMWVRGVFITDLCVPPHTASAKLLPRDGGAGVHMCGEE